GGGQLPPPARAPPGRWGDCSPAVRTDVLNKLDLKVPGTWDQLRTVLQAMKAVNPSSFPFSDRWGVPTPGGALLNTMAQAYGTRAGWGYFNATWDSRVKKFVFTGAQDRFKA